MRWPAALLSLLAGCASTPAERPGPAASECASAADWRPARGPCARAASEAGRCP
ncbi:MAG: hypothetical protein IT374_28300, partial [Polyangiaceae bacterium]|nr:hypothetical protein [Polyangiaceae bacterium]